MVNGYGNDSGYGNSLGYGNSEPSSGYGGSDLDSGYGTSGFEDTAENGTPNTALGAGNNPWRTRNFACGYRGNQFEVNPCDTPWTETAANPIPQGEGYGSAVGPGLSQGRPEVQPPEAELPPSPPPQGVVNSETGPSRSGQAPKRRQRTYGDDQLML